MKVIVWIRGKVRRHLSQLGIANGRSLSHTIKYKYYSALQ